MVFVSRVSDRCEKFLVPTRAAHILGRGGTSPTDAERIAAVDARSGDGIDGDVMAPAVAEVILVDKLANGFPKSGLKGVVALICDPQLFQLGRLRTEGSFPELKAVQVGVAPPHHELQQVVQFGQAEGGGYQDPSPDPRLDVLELDMQRIHCKAGRASLQIPAGSRCELGGS